MAKKSVKKFVPKHPDIGDMTSISEDLDSIFETLEMLSIDEEWTKDELSTLEDLRHSSLKAARAIEATIETYKAYKNAKEKQAKTESGQVQSDR